MTELKLDLRSISTRIGQPESKVRAFYGGNLSNSDIRTFEDYKWIYNIRHDIVHSIITTQRGQPFGERPVDTFPIHKAHSHKYYSLVKNQTPDVMEVNGNKISITEFSVSSAQSMEKTKYSKYSLLIKVLRDSGYSVNIEVIIISPSPTMMDIETLRNQHHLTESSIQQIRQVLFSSKRLLFTIHRTNQGLIWFREFHNIDSSTIKTSYSNDDVIDYHESKSLKAFNSVSDLREVLESKEGKEMNSTDEEFIEAVLDTIPNMASKSLHKHVEPNLTEFYNNMSSQNYHKRPSILPLPYLDLDHSDTMERRLWSDEQKVTRMKAQIRMGEDQIMQQLVDSSSDFMYKKYTTPEVRLSIANQGPNRRKYVRTGRIHDVTDNQPNKNIGLIPDSESSLIEELSYHLSERKELAGDVTSINWENLGSRGLRMVKCWQSIFREICVNVQRRPRRNHWIIRPTSIPGVFIFIHPGPKMRTGENVSIIWYKVLMDYEYKLGDEGKFAPYFKTFKRETTYWQTRWLSIDANRLDHYIRCYDKILMAYLSYLEKDKNSHSIIEAYNNDKSNTLGMIIMTYMENKRMTSKLLQDVRFIIMGTLSITVDWSEHIKKLIIPVRSTLQSYYLKRMVGYIKDYRLHQSVALRSREFGDVKLNVSTDEVDDSLSGSSFLMNRILTCGDVITFPEMLCEMYFTMLFNKNQDDPTHSSFQILNKMLIGEKSLREVKDTTKLHTGLVKGDIPDMIDIMITPHKHQFSRRAIMIGAKLQSISAGNTHPGGLAHELARSEKIINKPLEEFATYKSSAVTESLIYRNHLDKVYGRKKDQTNDDRFKGIMRQNKRRRCLEAIMEMTDGGMFRSEDVIPKALQTDNIFQVFKKNQIGGVREILILEMNKRILINILESYSRVICKHDCREMLTAGSVKYSVFNNIQRQARETERKNIQVHLNMDKSKWGPTFMPIQFLYLFVPFKSELLNLFNIFAMTLINHTNKKCLLPERLIRAWVKDKSNSMKHPEAELQMLKEHFLRTKEIFFHNESNMGQGILHYTSSLCHLAMISFRDEIYKRLCVRNHVEPVKWEDLVSSDDSYTCLSIGADNKLSIQLRLVLFLQAQEASELLFNMRTSRQKSSISVIVSEFNSLFGSNLTSYPTTFKFALSSVMPQNTDSFYRMVKESYNASRQIYENGGSMELYMVSHILNQKYCERMYHTHPGGQNDPTKFGLRRENIPYHMGVYPIGDPTMMIMMGPEFHNYRIFDTLSTLNDVEHRLFYNCHRMISIKNPEVFAELDTFDNLYTSVNRIEAKMAPIRRLEIIKSKSKLTREQIYDMIADDLLILFRPSRNSDEAYLKTVLKLYQSSSSEALRITASSLYFARMSATVSANAFGVTNSNNSEKRTYDECFREILEGKTDIGLDPLYPYQREYSNMSVLSGAQIEYRIRDPMETMSSRKLVLTEMNIRIRNPIHNLLEDHWVNGMPRDNSSARDWINLKTMIPMMHDTYEETLDEFKGSKTEKTMQLLLLILRLHGYSTRPMKAVCYGRSSKSYDDTYMIIKAQNMYSGLTSKSILDVELKHERNLVSRLHNLYNIFILSNAYNKTCPNLSEHMDEGTITKYCLDNFRSYHSKRRILSLLAAQDMIPDVVTWTLRTKTVMHQWLVRQKFIAGEYKGSFSIIGQYGSNKMILDYNGLNYTLTASSTQNEKSNHLILEHLCLQIGKSIDDVIKNVPSGYFTITRTLLIKLHNKQGFDVARADIQDIEYYISETKIQNGWIFHYDGMGNRLMRVKLGLLPIEDYEPSPVDVIVNGISYNDIVRIGGLRSEFNIDSCDSRQLLSMINDMKTPKPIITPVTKARLRLGSTWMTEERKDVIDIAENKTYVIEDFKISQPDLLGEVKEDAMLYLMSADLSLLSMDVKEMISEVESYDHMTWLDIDVNSSYIQNILKTTDTYRPQSLWNQVNIFKQLIICRMVATTSDICSSIINGMHALMGNNDITYSLITVYDRLYSDQDAPSPKTYNTKIFPDFLDKFGLSVGSNIL